MSYSIWRHVRDEQYRKEKGLDKRDRERERESDRIADERMRRDMGPDHKPGSPYSDFENH